MRRQVLAALLVLLCLLSACAKPSAQIPPAEIPPTPHSTSVPTIPPQTNGQTVRAEPAPEDFVRVADYVPGIAQELRYATDRNFTGQAIYDFSDAYLRYGTVKKLAAVREDLAELGLSLKIWDAYRPTSAQFALWEICPNPAFVANPHKGFSSHSRGNTLDVTLVDADGNELEMPTGFDDFSDRADRDYSDCTETAAAHAQLLEILMEKHGFRGYSAEWWHYSDTDEYPVEESFTPS